MRKLSLSALFLPLALLCSSATAQCLQNCPERRSISVTATDSATADADLAIVRVGYRIYGADARTAYASASQSSNAIMQALTGSGVPISGIESSGQVLQRTAAYELEQRSLSNEEQLQREFTATQSWVIRVKPDDASKALNTAVNAGANESGWIEWVVQNSNALQAHASAKAFADTQRIAEQMAQQAHVRLGPLASSNTSFGSPMSGYLNNSLGSITGGVAGMQQSATQPLAINSRRVEVTVTTYAVFAIE
jgi:uncharacterized protein YggE